MHDLLDKNIIVTGASSGLGRGTSIVLSQLGARLCLIGRNEAELEKTLELMEGKNHLVCPLDLCDFARYRETFAYMVTQLGLLHGLVHFAGIRKTLPLKIMKLEQLREMFEINFFSFLELVKFFSLKSSVDAAGGSIVAISSVAALRGISGLVGYSSSKAALDSAVRSLTCELANRHIRVNSIAPGYVETPMNVETKKTLSDAAYAEIIKKHPLGIGEPKDVAHLTAFLLSDKAKWITGNTIPIDGGFAIRS